MTDAPADIAIDVRDVYKSFGTNRVFAGIDVAVRRGEVLTVLGPSGGGKSVLLKMIVGLLKPTAGHIFVCGEDVVPLDERQLRRVRRRVALVFQGAALFDSMTVGENVAYGLLEQYRWPASRVRARVAECLAWVGLSGAESVAGIERMRPAALSGGMRKRVALARALAPGPEVILYDEPTTGLDPANTRRIVELIRSLQARLGVTSMVITHDIRSALAVSDRVALIRGGRVPVAVGVEVARDAPPPALRAFIAGEPENQDQVGAGHGA